MAGDHSEAHIKAVALALYQIRILLSGYLGTHLRPISRSVRLRILLTLCT